MAVRRRLLADGYGARRLSYVGRVDNVAEAASASDGSGATRKVRRFLGDAYAIRAVNYFGKRLSAQTFSDTVSESATAGFTARTAARRRVMADGYAIRGVGYLPKSSGGTTYSDNVTESVSASFSGSTGSTIHRRLLGDGYALRQVSYSGKTPAAQAAVFRRGLSDFGGRIGSRQAA